MPYLLTQHGLKMCSVRQYVPSKYINYYNSQILQTLTKSNNSNEKIFTSYKRKYQSKSQTKQNFDVIDDNCVDDWPFNYEKKLKEPHKFLNVHLIKPLSDPEIKVMLLFLSICLLIIDKSVYFKEIICGLSS